MFVHLYFLNVHLSDESATDAIARFCGSLAVPAHQWCALLLAGYSLHRPRLPNEVLPESRKNTHSHPSNCCL